MQGADRCEHVRTGAHPQLHSREGKWAGEWEITTDDRVSHENSSRSFNHFTSVLCSLPHVEALDGKLTNGKVK
jgi:hypothetical protein